MLARMLESVDVPRDIIRNKIALVRAETQTSVRTSIPGEVAA
jgi:hypothetical protein